EDGIRDYKVTGVQTCALPISLLTNNTGIGRILSGSASVDITAGAGNISLTAGSGIGSGTGGGSLVLSSSGLLTTNTGPSNGDQRSEERRVGQEWRRRRRRYQ